MLKFVRVAGIVLGLAALAPSAEANHRHHPHHRYDHHHRHAHAHRDDGQFRLGYHRAGPARGYRFGFYTYAGDPFARDDYYDGRRCYYLHRRDFCRGPRAFGWIR